jgi:diguanylate cyclase (GGDEF)-like protein/PAS domain S-box-containing protein
VQQVFANRAGLASIVLWGTVSGGLAAIAFGGLALLESRAWLDVLPFVALAIVADLLTVDLLETRQDRFSFSFAIAVIMLAVMINPVLSPLVALAASVGHVARSKYRRLDKILFNLTNLPLATGVAIIVYLSVLPATGASGVGGLVAAFSAVVAFYAMNTMGVSLMISLTAARPLGEVMHGSAWSIPINLCLGLTGAFLGSGHSELGVLGTGMFVIPLALLRFTLVIFSRKSRDTIKTLETLNEQLSDEVAQRSVAEEALGESEAHLRAVLDNVAEGILTVDDRGRIETCNPAGEQVFGFPAAEVGGRHLGDLVPMLRSVRSGDAGSFRQLLAQVKLGSEPQETSGRHRDGGTFPIEVAIGEMRQHADRFVVSVRDITERKQAQAALEHQAVHDALTGLPNRLLLHDRLSQAILSARRDETPLALLVMDLDRFKEVNDTLGHHFGDLLLRELGGRLRGMLRGAETAARLGGDEFAVLLPLADVDEAEDTARRLLAALEQPFMVDGHPVEVGASIGVSVFPDHGSDPGTLLQRADVAMYVAKRTQSQLSVYAPDQDQHSPGRLSLAAELRTAIESNQLELFYQPKAELATGRVLSVEALVRWRHPQRGLVPPDEFIPLAEQSGQVRALSRWVLNAALRQARAWDHLGRNLGMAVNLSMRDLHDTGLPETVAALLKTWAVRPSTLTIEITESTLMADPAQAMEIVRRLSVMGVNIAIDDFGTGYSSLSYLKRLAVNELKVDRSFVRNVVSDAHDVAIVRSTISLAHELGLEVVAEGIEDQATWDLLAALGCDTAQGYLISRPLPAPEFNRWMTESGWLIGAAPDEFAAVA